MIKKNFFHNNIFNLLIFLILVSPFIVYKYVDYFRANQEFWVKLISLFIFFLILIKILDDGKLVISSDKFSILLLVFYLYLSFSLIYSSNRVLTARTLFLFFCYIFLSLLIINIKIKNKINRLSNIFIISALLISVYTIIHYYGFIKYFAEFGPVFSPIGQKNWTSNFLSLVLPCSFALYLLEMEKTKKRFYFITIAIIYTSIIICQSRGIWISILLTMPIAFILIKKGNLSNIFRKNRRSLTYLVFILIIITAIYSTDNPLNKSSLTVPQKAFSVLDREDHSINMRLIMLNSSLRMIEKRPLFGFGLGTFNLHYPNYQAIYLQNRPDMIKYLSNNNVLEAHNEYIQMCTEVGIIGISIFIFMILYLYKKSWDLLNRNGHDPKSKILYLGIFLGINIYLIHSLFTFPFHVAFLGASFFILLGMAISLQENNKREIRTFLVNIELNKLVKAFTLIGLCLIFIISVDIFIINPYLSEVYSFRGQKSYYIDNDLNGAIGHFEKAVQLDPYNGRILLHLGATYINSNLLNKAILTLDKSKEFYKDKNIYRNIAIYYLKSGSNKKAKELFKKAIDYYPNYIEAYNDLASQYIYDEEYNKAIRQWERAIELNLNFEEKHIFLYYIGMAYQKKEMPEKVLEYFLQALQLAPEGDPIIEEIEEEIYNIYKESLNK